MDIANKWQLSKQEKFIQQTSSTAAAHFTPKSVDSNIFDRTQCAKAFTMHARCINCMSYLVHVVFVALFLFFRLESALSSMMAKLHDLFRHLYLTPKYVADEDSQRLLRGVFNMQSTLHTGLLDYKDYIAIKTQRNVAMTKYPFST